MTFLVAVGASTLLGLVRGGSLSNLATLRFRHLWLLVVAVLLWLVTGPLPIQLWLHLSAIAPLLLLAGHAMLLLFIWQNRQVPWLLVVGLGLLANFLVMAANGGQMPLDAGLMKAMGLDADLDLQLQQGLWVHTRLITPETRLAFLGDVLYLGPPFPWPRILSAGDVLVALGVFLVIQVAMLRPPLAVTSRKAL